MRPYLLRPRAIQDLEEIADYTFEKWGSEQEDFYLELLEKAFVAVTKNPNIGRIYDEIHPCLRRYLAGRHIILYQVSDVAIEIVRVLHHSMDFESHL
jgi:toxin ParE1/3/4